MDLRSTYNKIAKDWTNDHRGVEWWSKGTDKFLSFLEAKASILDVGCGGGHEAKYMSERGFEVTGIDFSEEMLAIAKKYAPKAEFFLKDIRQPLDFRRTFSGIFAQAVLIHIPKKEIVGVLKNITDPLKSDGFLMALVIEMQPGGKNEEIVREKAYGYDYERFFSYFTLGELKKYFACVGLDIVYSDIITSRNTRWLQVIARKS